MVSGVSNISLPQSCSLDICSLPCQGRKSRAKEAFGLWILVVCAWIWIEFVWLHCKRMKVVQIFSRSSSHEKPPADLSCFFWLPWNQDRGWCKRLQVRKKKGFQWINNDKNDSTTTATTTTTTSSTAILKLQLKVLNTLKWLPLAVKARRAPCRSAKTCGGRVQPMWCRWVPENWGENSSTYKT